MMRPEDNASASQPPAQPQPIAPQSMAQQTAAQQQPSLPERLPPQTAPSFGPQWTAALRSPFQFAYAVIRKLVVLVLGIVVLLAGLVMIIAPGPALLVIPLGLGILATEFPIAGRWLKTLHNVAIAVWQRLCDWFPILRRIPFLYQQPVVKRLSDHRPPPNAQ